jgi:hypothetical protein
MAVMYHSNDDNHRYGKRILMTIHIFLMLLELLIADQEQ